MIYNNKNIVRQKMVRRIAELSRIYPYSRQRRSGYSGQMFLSSYTMR